MFKQRVMTALILIPLVLWAIEKANSWILGGLAAACLCLAAYEWFALIPITALLMQGLIYCTLILFTYLAWIFWPVAIVIGLGLWMFIALCILTYPASQAVWGHKALVALMSVLILPITFISICGIYSHSSGKDLIIYLLFLVWATDTGGYLVGKQWGKHRLIPKVSPGKTVEGALGGMFFALIVAGFGYFWFKPMSILVWFGLTLIIVAVSMVGDLFFSMLKRRVQLKDTGKLIPGHGGVLDRLDSLMAAAPFFYASLIGAIF